MVLEVKLNQGLLFLRKLQNYILIRVLKNLQIQINPVKPESQFHLFWFYRLDINKNFLNNVTSSLDNSKNVQANLLMYEFFYSTTWSSQLLSGPYPLIQFL